MRIEHHHLKSLLLYIPSLVLVIYWMDANYYLYGDFIASGGHFIPCLLWGGFNFLLYRDYFYHLLIIRAIIQSVVPVVFPYVIRIVVQVFY